MRADDGQEPLRRSSTPTDEDVLREVYFWKTPIEDCGDDRGEVCKDYSGVDARLDGDQGLADRAVASTTVDRTSAAAAAGSAAGGGSRRSSSGTRGARLGAAARRRRSAWLGDRATSARWRCCSSRRSGDSTRSRARSSTSWNLDNFRTICRAGPSTATIALRTIGMAAAVTRRLRAARVPDRVLHGPRRLAADAELLFVAILLPLWASYLVKVYAWRIDPVRDGRAQLGCSSRSGSRRTRLLDRRRRGSCSRYLWLPFMILPIYAGLERIPHSLLEASADLGAKRGRDVPPRVLPLAFPASSPARSSRSR